MTQLSEQTSRLVRDELKLARAELTAKTKQGGMGAGFLGAGGILAWFGFAALVTTAILALALVLPAWAAALIVTVVLFAAAGIAALLGKKKIENLSPTPEKTKANVQRDVAEVKEHSRHEHA
ncbi:phage holin family protein [Zhihengliuella sp.]|uniref:phage holin family protein n=1 Tax=Zhihengliuella sp. TaxID=1954483 RepID=UPI0028122067|nr:phage holin family protein [Zhihengliuella sp.]